MFPTLTFTSVLMAAAASSAMAANITVTVGGTGLVYTPSNVQAQIGDVVQFNFGGGIPHTVTQMDPSNPCQPLSNGFATGAVSSKTSFSLSVSSTDPIYYFCSTPTHCEAGMVGSINDNGQLSSITTAAQGTNGQTPSVSAAASGSGAAFLPASSSASSGGPLSASSSSSSSSAAPSSTGGSSKSGAERVGMGLAGLAVGAMGVVMRMM